MFLKTNSLNIISHFVLQKINYKLKLSKPKPQKKVLKNQKKNCATMVKVTKKPKKPRRKTTRRKTTKGRPVFDVRVIDDSDFTSLIDTPNDVGNECLLDDFDEWVREALDGYEFPKVDSIGFVVPTSDLPDIHDSLYESVMRVKENIPCAEAECGNMLTEEAFVDVDGYALCNECADDSCTLTTPRKYVKERDPFDVYFEFMGWEKDFLNNY